MKRVVGVMGPGEKQATTEDISRAYEVGKMVAESGSVLLCGGMTGVMESSAKGAHENGGLVVGICPTMDKNDMNEYIDIPIVTGMHSGRNFMNITSSDILVFVSVHSPGTLSELAYAIQLEKPSVIIGGNKELKDYVATFETDCVQFVDDLPAIEKFL